MQISGSWWSKIQVKHVQPLKWPLGLKNPSWLKSDKFKVDRGVYTLDIDSDTIFNFNIY